MIAGLVWVLLGVVFIIVEIFTVTFASLWFAFSAFIVAICIFFFPELAKIIRIQFALWAVFSFVSMFFWFKIYSPMREIERKNRGLKSGALIGERGVIVRIPRGDTSGTIRFHLPICGDTDWECWIEDDDINIGDNVKVIGVENKTLVVSLIKK